VVLTVSIEITNREVIVSVADRDLDAYRFRYSCQEGGK